MLSKEKIEEDKKKGMCRKRKRGVKREDRRKV